MSPSVQALRRRGFTLAEIMVVLVVTSLALLIIYQIYYGSMIRVIAVTRRAEGQQAVRILLLKLRHELKRAIAVVRIETGGQKLTIPLEDRAKPRDDPNRYHYTQYEYFPQRKEIMVRTLDHDMRPVEEHPWLGGRNQILRFKCYHTGEDERILFQYYRVRAELEHYDVKMRDRGVDRDVPIEEQKDVIHMTTTVYPRRVNMELRIEVPQDEASGA